MDKLHEAISRALIELRSQKIKVLEEYDLILGERTHVESQIKRIEAQQLRKVHGERNKKEAFMLSLLTKKEQMKKKLKDTTELYQQRRKIADIR